MKLKRLYENKESIDSLVDDIKESSEYRTKSENLDDKIKKIIEPVLKELLLNNKRFLEFAEGYLHIFNEDDIVKVIEKSNIKYNRASYFMDEIYILFNIDDKKNIPVIIEKEELEIALESNRFGL